MKIPKVFVSYSHESRPHKDRVLDFTERLRTDGVDAWIDQYSPWPKEGWPKWTEFQIRDADFILLVCTETYARRVSGEEVPGRGRGVIWEANLIYNALYRDQVRSDRFIPILFQGSSPESIPAPLQGFPHYNIVSEDGYEDLYRRLTKQPRAIPSEVRQPRQLKKLEPLRQRAATEANYESATDSATIRLFLSLLSWFS